MASPFSIFRKHQKVMIAGLAVMAMIAFVFLDYRFWDNFTGKEGTNPVVVRTTKYGNLRLGQINGLVGQRQHLLGFFRTLEGEINRSKGDIQKIEIAMRIIGPATEQSVVDRWLFSREAERAGIAIADQAINDFLRDVTDNRVSSQDMGKLLRQQRVGLSEVQLFAILREELLALRFRELFHQLSPEANRFNVFGASIPPGQRWEYFQRLNRFATVEVASVPVERYVDKVSDPDEKTLREFFDRYKEVVSRPESPDPGFREPAKMDFQYFKGEQEKFLATVTEAEIKQQYEKFKDRYEKEEQAEQAAEKEAEKAAEKKDDAAKPELEKPAAKPEAEKAAAKPSETVTPGLQKPEPEKPAAKPEPAKPATKPEAAKPKPDDKSAAPARSPFRLVSYADEKSDEKSDQPAKKKSDKKKSEAKKGAKKAKDVPATPSEPKTSEKPETPAPPSKPEKAEPPATPPKIEKPAEKPQAEKPAAKPEAEKPAAKPEAEKPSAKPEKSETSAPVAKPEKPPVSTPAKAAPPKEVPSKQVKDRIRRDLAYEKMAVAINQLQDVMMKYRTQWTRYDAERQRNANATKPASPDFDALAKQHGLIAGKTGSMIQTDLVQTDIGRSSLWTSTGDARGMAQIPFARHAFETKVLYLPERSMDGEGNVFLFWRIDEVADRVPSFEDPGVADQVRRAWKMIEARDVASKAAEEFRQQAAKSPRPLMEAFAGHPELRAFKTQPFSWMTFGHVPAEPLSGQLPAARLSQVEGVAFAGQDFMKAVFNLSPGELGVALNQPKTIAYVIRLVELTPPEKDLLKTFEEGDPFFRYASVALADQQEVDQAWKAEVMAAAGFKWERKPEHRVVDYD